MLVARRCAHNVDDVPGNSGPATAGVLAVYFLLELTALAALAVGGAHLGNGAAEKIGLAVLFPAAGATVWGRFAAPKSAHRHASEASH